MITKIYGLYDKDRKLRYVGKTLRTIEQRLAAHLCEAGRREHNHRLDWVRSCLKQNYIPMIKLIEETEGNGNLEEMFYILFYRQQGADLVNGTEGGDGRVGCKHTEETKQKMSEAHRGKLFTVDTKRKMSKSHCGKQHTDEAKQKMRVWHRGKSLSMETKQKMRKSISGEKNHNFGKPMSKEQKQKISETMKYKFMAKRVICSVDQSYNYK